MEYLLSNSWNTPPSERVPLTMRPSVPRKMPDLSFSQPISSRSANRTARQGQGSNEEVPAIRQGRQAAYQQSAGPNPPKKSTTNRPREGLPSRRYGSATRNTRRLIENPPGPTACDPAWENKACRANKTVWFLSPSSSPIWTGRSEHEHRNLRHPQRGPLT